MEMSKGEHFRAELVRPKMPTSISQRSQELSNKGVRDLTFTILMPRHGARELYIHIYASSPKLVSCGNHFYYTYNFSRAIQLWKCECKNDTTKVGVASIVDVTWIFDKIEFGQGTLLFKVAFPR